MNSGHRFGLISPAQTYISIKAHRQKTGRSEEYMTVGIFYTIDFINATCYAMSVSPKGLWLLDSPKRRCGQLLKTFSVAKPKPLR